jgi:anti-anti-sigma regulatory factor
MATNDPPPVYLVKAGSDPAVLIINGRASYLNCAPVAQFFEKVLKQGRREFILDFSRCTGMDSTFLGVIAGAALEARKAAPPGKITVLGLNPRNLELVRNLGLHRLLVVDSGDFPMEFSPGQPRALAADCPEVANARLILNAHESLCTADEQNRGKFQDVLQFLKSQVEKDPVATK